MKLAKEQRGHDHQEGSSCCSAINKSKFKIRIISIDSLHSTRSINYPRQGDIGFNKVKNVLNLLFKKKSNDSDVKDCTEDDII